MLIFHLVFLYVNIISISWFLTILSLTFVLTHLLFFYSVVHFLFTRNIAYGFLSWHFDFFHSLPVGFPLFFLTILFLLYLHQILDNWWRTTNIFHYSPLWIAFINEIYDLFYCFNWKFFYWSRISFQLGEVCKNSLTVNQFAYLDFCCLF